MKCSPQPWVPGPVLQQPLLLSRLCRPPLVHLAVLLPAAITCTSTLNACRSKKNADDLGVIYEVEVTI